MRKLRNFLSFFILFPLFVHSQPKDPEASLSEYFELPRESIYVHLNKSTYVQGDEMWFSGYVYDRKGEVPFTKTTNIKIGVYDDKGTLIQQGLYLGRDGYFKGNIFVDSTYTVGNYYFRATTKWMKNFREDGSYVQKIKVVDPLKGPSIEEDFELAYDVQFLPEGGNLISGITNNIGVKILDDRGYGVTVDEVIVYDNNDNPVTVFETSSLGMAKFELHPQESRSYRARVRFLDGSEQWYDLPSVNSKGINIRLNLNPHQGRIGVAFAMNAQTFEEVGSDGYYFLLHKDGDFKKVPVEFNDKNFEAAFFLEEENLKTGLNTITLFNNDNKPILERMFFVTDGLKQVEPGVQLVSINKDSLRLAVTSEIDELNLSISVLPADSKSYNHYQNSLSTFYLKPYVNGFIENPRYYFENMDKGKAYELDLLLLTQGWSRYRWKNIQQLGPPEPKYPFEDGIALKGAVNGLNPKFKGNLILYGTKYHGQQLLPISHQENQFLITPFFPENGEQLYFSLLDNKGRTSKPGAYFKLLSDGIADNFLMPKHFDSYTFSQKPTLVERDYNVELIKDKTILLDEVTVVEDKLTPLSQDHSNVYIPAFIKNKVTWVDQKMVRENIFLEDYLRRFYDVSYDGVGNLIIRSWRGVGVNVIVDDAIGIPLQGRLPMGQIEAIWRDRLSRYLGARNRLLGEALYIYTKRGKEILPYGEPGDKKVYALTVENGFEGTKEFYVPKYSTFESQAYEDYGIVHWEPELIIDKNEMEEISFLNTGKEQILVFVEGMSKNGALVSLSKVFTIDSNK